MSKVITSLKWLLPHPVLSVVLWVIWLLLNNTVGAGHMVLGAILAIIIPKLTSGFWPEKVCIKAPLTLLKFLSVVLWDILVANIAVAKLILGKNDALKPGFFELELSITSPIGISLLANTISLTPGTVSCDLTPDGKRLIIHAIHLDDIDDTISQIKSRYETPLKKVFTVC